MNKDEDQTREGREDPSWIDTLIQSDKLKEAAVKLAVKEGTFAIEKYKKKGAIVEEGTLSLKVVLDVEDAYMPLTEIRVDDLHLGYINEKRKCNEADFNVPCYKKGDGKWDTLKVIAKPIRDYAKYFNTGSYTARFAPSSGGRVKTITVYIPITIRRNWYRKKVDIPKTFED